MVPLWSHPYLHGLFVLLALGWVTLKTTLSLRNLVHNESMMRDRKQWLRTVIGYDDVEEVITYLRLKTGVGIVGGIYTAMLVLGLYYGGLFTRFFRWYVDVAPGGIVFSGTLLVPGLLVVNELLSLPRSLYDVFVIEERFGFNRMGPGDFVRQKAKKTLVSLVISTGLAAGILWLIVRFPLVWPIPLMAGFAGVYLVMSLLVPNLILPFFYDHQPLPDGALKDRVTRFLKQHDLAIGQRIFVEERSRETTKSNAYFAGFGPFKRLVLTDTLLEDFSVEEILGVLAHEVGHWQHSHQWKRIGATFLGTALQCGVVYFLLEADWLYGMWNVPDTPYVGLLLAVQWTLPLGLITRPLMNGYSRYTERQADAYATDHDLGDALASALSRLAETNYAVVFPDPIYALFNSSHPTLPERIRRAASDP